MTSRHPDIQTLFNNIAPRYDLLNHLLSLNLDRLWRKRATQLLVGLARVLDLCAGTLDLSTTLSRKSPETSIDAVDFSREMLEIGRSKVRGDPKIRLHECDAHNLPFEEGSFDGAMVAYGMRNLEDNERALKEVVRVLKPAGRFVILEFFRPEKLNERFFAAAYMRLIVPFLGGLISGSFEAYRYLYNTIQSFYSLDEYKNLMQRCGFTNISSRSQLGGANHLVWGSKKL